MQLVVLTSAPLPASELPDSHSSQHYTKDATAFQANGFAHEFTPEKEIIWPVYQGG
jgi:hypothetical protein